MATVALAADASSVIKTIIAKGTVVESPFGVGTQMNVIKFSDKKLGEEIRLYYVVYSKIDNEGNLSPGRFDIVVELWIEKDGKNYIEQLFILCNGEGVIREIGGATQVQTKEGEVLKFEPTKPSMQEVVVLYELFLVYFIEKTTVLI